MSTKRVNLNWAGILKWGEPWPVSLALLGLGIFYVWPNSYAAMVAWPGIWIWQLAFLVAMVGCILGLRQFHLPWRGLGSGLDGGILLLVITLVISSLLAPFPAVSGWYLVMTGGYLALLYGVRNSLGQGWFTLPRLWVGMVTMSLITAAVGLGLWFMVGEPLAIPEAWNWGPRNTWPLGDHNFMAGYLVISLPLALALVLAPPGGKRIQPKRILGGVSAALGLADLFTTGSRGGILGLLVSGVLVWILLVFQQRGRQRRNWLIGGLLVLLLTGSLFLTHPRVRNVIQVQWHHNSSPLHLDGTASYRFPVWQVGLNALQAHPWGGSGLGNMSRVFNLYDPLVGRTNAIAELQQLHGTPFQLMAELGVLGLISYAAALVLLGRLWMQVYRPWPDPQGQNPTHGAYGPLLYGIAASLVAYGISSLTDYQLEAIPISLSLLLLVGMLVHIRDLTLPQSLSPASLSGKGRRILSVMILVTTGLSLWVWIPTSAAMALAAQAEHAWQHQQYSAAHQQLVRAAGFAPQDPTYPFLDGTRLLTLSDRSQDAQTRQRFQAAGLERLNQAVATSPYSPFLNSYLGISLLEVSPDQAATHLERTVQLYPYSGLGTHIYSFLGMAYLRQGKPQAATSAFALQALITPAFLTYDLWEDPALRPLRANTYVQTRQWMNLLLADLTPQDPAYNLVYENRTLLQWWLYPQDLQLSQVELPRLRRIAQAVLLASRDPEAALSRLSQTPESLWLQAWLDPEQFWPRLQAQMTQVESISPASQEKLRKALPPNSSSLHDWLTAANLIAFPYQSRLGFYTYRNSFFPEVITFPRPIRKPLASEKMGLFATDVLPQTHRLLQRIQAQALNLPTLTFRDLDP